MREIRLEKVTCRMCRRWWTWPGTLGRDDQTHVIECPICTGRQVHNACCSWCGSMLSDDFSFPAPEGLRRCLVCHLNAKRAEIEYEEVEDSLYEYTEHLGELCMRDLEQPETTPTVRRCRCNKCAGRRP